MARYASVLQRDSRAPTSLRSPTPNTPQSADGILCKSFYSQSHLSKLRFDCSEGDFCVIPKSADGRGFEGTDLALLAHLEYPQSADGILCKTLSSSSLKRAWTQPLKRVLRREGDSNPRNPFGVYTLSRRASSTTRASLLRRNWLARRNSPCEFGLPPLLLLTRAHNTPQKLKF